MKSLFWRSIIVVFVACIIALAITIITDPARVQATTPSDWIQQQTRNIDIEDDNWIRGYLEGSTYVTLDVNPAGLPHKIFTVFDIWYETASNEWAQMPTPTNTYTYTDADADGILDQLYFVATNGAEAGGEYIIWFPDVDGI